MVPAFLALGSNLGDRADYLKRAVDGLQAHGVVIVRQASIYETEPKDVGEQPWFLNSVIEVNTTLDPLNLLVLCLAIEQRNQRVRAGTKSARTLDIDIIFYGTLLLRQEQLIIPHPHFAERKFVLIPMAEIAPDFTDPRSTKTIAALLRECRDSSTVRLWSPTP
jgi:2-amino-4-hydroxy-6-hydroxymethyldihydropteridine diphosphokinase